MDQLREDIAGKMRTNYSEYMKKKERVNERVERVLCVTTWSYFFLFRAERVRGFGNALSWLQNC